MRIKDIVDALGDEIEQYRLWALDQFHKGANPFELGEQAWRYGLDFKYNPFKGHRGLEDAAEEWDDGISVHSTADEYKASSFARRPWMLR